MEEYCLKPEERELLRKPFGDVFFGDEIVKKALEEKKRIIVVGDYSLKLFLDHGVKPDLAIVDFKTERKEVGEDIKQLFLSNYKIRINFKNKQGCIGENSLKLPLLRDLIRGSLIIVEGEEDLVALPLVLTLKENEVLIYGLRGKGGVLVKKGERLKEVEEAFSHLF